MEVGYSIELSAVPEIAYATTLNLLVFLGKSDSSRLSIRQQNQHPSSCDGSIILSGEVRPRLASIFSGKHSKCKLGFLYERYHGSLDRLVTDPSETEAWWK